MDDLMIYKNFYWLNLLNNKMPERKRKRKETKAPVPIYDSINDIDRQREIVWLFKTCYDEDLGVDSFFRAAWIFDKCRRLVTEKDSRFVSATSLMIATKYINEVESVVYPDYVAYLTGKSISDVVILEINILKSINYNLNEQTIWEYLKEFYYHKNISIEAKDDTETYIMGNIIIMFFMLFSLVTNQDLSCINTKKMMVSILVSMSKDDYYCGFVEEDVFSYFNIDKRVIYVNLKEISILVNDLRSKFITIASGFNLKKFTNYNEFNKFFV